MSNFSKYSGSYGKVCAMKSKLLKKDDYDRLVSCGSLGALADYLKNTEAYSAVLENADSSDISVSQLEKYVALAADRDLLKLCRFISDDGRKFIRILVMKKEIETLKRIFRSVYSGAEYENEAGGMFLYSAFSVDVKALLSLSNVTDFMENLKNTVYRRAFSHFDKDFELSPFDFETALDCFYYQYAWNFTSKYLTGTDKKNVKRFLGNEIDIQNILWLIRSRKYYKFDKSIVKSKLIPVCYRLKKDKLSAMADVSGTEALYAEIASTPYAKYFESQNGGFEKNIETEFVENMAKCAKINPFSLFSVVEFCAAKEQEIKNIIKIAEALRYGVCKTEISAYLILKGGCM